MPEFRSRATELCVGGDKMQSFSSSLLDAMYRSMDESRRADDEGQEDKGNFIHRRNNAAQVEEEIESLRRAIMIEKWMQSQRTSTISTRHLPSNSGSSTDSSLFSSSETDSSASRSTSKSSLFPAQRLEQAQSRLVDKPHEATPKREGRFTKTKSKAMKIYGDLKKVKEPVSPGGKLTSFLNSIFSPRNLKKNNQALEEWNSMRKSRSMKDTKTTSLASSLSKNPSSKSNKSKRSVRFCPVSVILDENCQPCGHKNVYDTEHPFNASIPSNVGSQFIKKNIDSFRVYEMKNTRQKEFREFHEYDQCDFDDISCASSDLFELENIGRVGIEAYEEELPVYGTTDIMMNRAIARANSHL